MMCRPRELVPRIGLMILLVWAGCDEGTGKDDPGADQLDASQETVSIDAAPTSDAAPDAIPDAIPDLLPGQVDTQDAAGDVPAEISVDGELPGECGVDGDCPPTVGIESPAAGEMVHGPVEIEVAAGDDDVVVKVRFIVDGGLLAEDTQVPYRVTWETAEFDDGPHVLEVIAFDSADQIASAEISVTTDNTPPELALLSPAEGVIQHDEILLSADATDALQMERVEFTVDDGDPAVVAEAPWELEFDGSGLASGQHEVVATAFDAAGNEASVTREFLVDRPPVLALLAPEGGATVVGPIPVQVEAADDLGLASVTLSVDGQWAAELLPAGGGLYEALWTPAYEKGERLLSVTALDSVGQAASAAATVLVDHPITVGLQICADGVCEALDTDVELTGTVQLRAVAADDGATIVGVDFLVDGAPAYQDQDAPFDFPWDTTGVEDGARIVTAAATNALDETGDAQVQVLVNNCDLDHDDYAAQGCGGPDCDDGDPEINPSVQDLVGNAADENCDGLDGVDGDGDGYASEASGGDDCDDGLPLAHPCGDDLPGDGVDGNCDGVDALSCDDCIACTVDGLVVGACVHAPLPDGLPCDDGDLCTAPGTCQGGLCPAGPAVDCDDANPCTADGCVSETGCYHLPLDGISCGDEGICAGGECVTGQCPPGTMDLNGDPGDGCEYQCPTDPGFVDLPDPEGLDLDCDGVDGDLDGAIFVSPLGVDDGNVSGDIESPVATLAKGIELALLHAPPFAVYVAAGEYEEQLVLEDGVSLYGGYDPESWARDPQTWVSHVHWSTPGPGGVIAVLAQDIVTETVVAGFTLEAMSNWAPSGNSIAVSVVDCTDALVFSDNLVIAGDGGDGEEGPPGGAGEDGAPGGDGNLGCEYDGCSLCIGCSSCTLPPAGAGGSSPCGGDGGDGGQGGPFDGSGQAGSTAPGGLAQGGAGGTSGVDGDDGVAGDTGPSGAPGTGGTGSGSVLGDGTWSPQGGGDGGPGGLGFGGGGGGGGGGDEDDQFMSMECYTYGASGGGGGSGGCPGAGGQSGGGGGASMGFLVVDSSCAIESCVITRDAGGAGGSGGTGGAGGASGTGGVGGPGQVDDDEGGGGDGGAGGDGGPGGGGGGGSGGASFGIYWSGGAGPSCADNTFQAAGTPGAGGLGGWPNGLAGQAGQGGDISAETAQCFAGSGPCPVAIIQCTEGDEVVPQTKLHLYGDQSFAAGGSISKWAWSVEQPVGAQSVFVPSYTFPNPTFETNVAGLYVFHLTVWDQQNTPSCAPDSLEVAVIPDEAIHIELLWHTPEDLDETDEGPEAGADLDLHFTHPWAGGPDLDGDGAPDGWFDMPFDCFWFNAHPNWGSFDPSIDDEPGLDRDDTDGAGPENVNLNIPEPVTYRVGVHYWNDHGYGPSLATVRVYIDGQLVFEQMDVELVDSDMWEVCTVAWPSGDVTLVTDGGGGHKITPDYNNPFFFQ